MKKILILLVFAFAFLFAGCSAKTPVTLDEFKQTMQKAGYSIHDVTAQYGEIAQSVTVARKDNYQVEFFVLKSDEDAAASFASNKNRLEPMEGGNVKTSVTASNYSSYNLTTKDQFYGVYRVGHTMIYLRVPKEQKDAVSELVKALGYK